MEGFRPLERIKLKEFASESDCASSFLQEIEGERKMDIIDFLTNDHRNLRRKMSQIRQNLANPLLRSQLRELISDFELHESIESEVLFPGIRIRLKGLEQFISFNEASHKEIWKLLEWIMDCLNNEDVPGLERSFLYFSSEMTSHMKDEERVIYPLVKSRLDRESLELLWTNAKERYLLSAA